MDLQNSNLRTLAFVEAQMTKGLGRPTEYLIPFFQSIISNKAGEPFSIKGAITSIEETYGIEVPVYLAESLLPSLIRIGALTNEKHLGCHICQKATEQSISNDLNDFHFKILDEKLKSFAQKHDIQTPLSCSTWQQALLNFFSERESSTKIAKLKDKLIANPKERDDWLISKFIVEAQVLEPEVYSLIKKIYVGFAIADTISAIQYIGHKDDWNELSIIYDSTVLMRLLGTSGEFLKRATLEMHNLLLEIGCKTFYFDHNLSEVFHNIDALALKHQSGESMHRETAQALENGEITIGQINLLRGDADTRLGKLNITQIEMPQRLSSIKGQINPVELEAYLVAAINYRNNSYAAQVDAESIEKTLFLRADKKYTDLPKSKFVFVTHNTNYAKIASKYCKVSSGYNQTHVPPIITLNTLTRMAWLASDHGGVHLDITKELIINCFEASLPDEKWFNKFWSAIENTAPELLDMNTHQSLYLLDIRKAAEDISLGNSALLDQLDIPKILKNAKKNAEEQEKQHKEAIEEERMKNEQSYRNYLEEKERLEIEKQEILDQQKTETQQALSSMQEDHRRERSSLLENTTKLQDSLVKEKEENIKSMKKLQNICVTKAEKKARNLKWLLILLITIYVVVNIFLIFKYTWDTMEPITYILALVFAGVIYGIGIFKGRTLNPFEIIENYKNKKISDEMTSIGFNKNEFERMEFELLDIKARRLD